MELSERKWVIEVYDSRIIGIKDGGTRVTAWRPVEYRPINGRMCIHSGDRNSLDVAMIKARKLAVETKDTVRIRHVETDDIIPLDIL